MRWNKEQNKLVWNKDDEEYNKVEKNSNNYVTMNTWADMASSIYSFLKFTIDIAEQHSDSTGPVLDIKVWWEEEGSVVHSVYENLMVTDTVIMGKVLNQQKDI